MRIQQLISLLWIILLLSACSGDKNDQAETATEKMTREVAEKSVEQIQAPIDKAHEAAALAEKHARQIEEKGDKL